MGMLTKAVSSWWTGPHSLDRWKSTRSWHSAWGNESQSKLFYLAQCVSFKTMVGVGVGVIPYLWVFTSVSFFTFLYLWDKNETPFSPSTLHDPHLPRKLDRTLRARTALANWATHGLFKPRKCIWARITLHIWPDSSTLTSKLYVHWEIKEKKKTGGETDYITFT